MDLKLGNFFKLQKKAIRAKVNLVNISTYKLDMLASYHDKWQSTISKRLKEKDAEKDGNQVELYFIYTSFF